MRIGERCLLVDAGLPPRHLTERLRLAGVPFRGIDHILVSHAHLDHARSAGVIARRHAATVHCPAAMLDQRSVRRAPRQVALHIASPRPLGPGAAGPTYTPIELPHDCAPTVAYRIEAGGRRLVILTDMGRPDETVARQLRGAHVLLLEFNHDAHMLATGPYAPNLRARIAGDRGHLSNEQAAAMLRRLAGPELHTLILGHLSAHNNTPELAQEAAREVLGDLGLSQVRILVAQQHSIGPSIEV